MRIVILASIAYLLIFISTVAFYNVFLALLLFPLFILFLFIAYKYRNSVIENKRFSVRREIFYLFLFFVVLSLNFVLSPDGLSRANIFTLFPTNNLSMYNIYINYAIITGFLILIIPDFRYQTLDYDYWQNNPFFKSIFSKIFFLIVLPIPVFIGFSYLLYKMELKEDANILLQTILIGCICAMSAYLFVVVKNLMSIVVRKFVK